MTRAPEESRDAQENTRRDILLVFLGAALISVGVVAVFALEAMHTWGHGLPETLLSDFSLGLGALAFVVSGTVIGGTVVIVRIARFTGRAWGRWLRGRQLGAPANGKLGSPIRDQGPTH